MFGALRLPDWLKQRWHDPSWAFYWLGVALVAAGLALAVWARIELTGNWSGTVTAGAFWRRIRLEERRLGEHFGDAYAEYRRTSWALIPFMF